VRTQDLPKELPDSCRFSTAAFADKDNDRIVREIDGGRPKLFTIRQSTGHQLQRMLPKFREFV